MRSIFLFLARLEASITEFSYKSLLPVRYLNDWPEAYFQMAIKDFAKKKKKIKSVKYYTIPCKTLSKETQSLYRAGLEYKLFNPQTHSGVCPNNRNH